ncbi:MAG: M67 family metallopeptidase [Bacteroidota bacterium]
MTSNIILSEAANEVINQHAIEAFPNECCGFLYGDEEKGRLIHLAQRVDNSKEGDQRRRFEISPRDYMKAERFALENNTQLLGIYHSHPNHPAIASEHDLAKAMPYFSYVIVSVMDGQIADTKSWKLLEEKRAFYEEQVQIGQNANPV